MYEAPEFSVSTERVNGFVVVSVAGELDEMTAPELEKELVVCDADGPVVVDLTKLTFISSSGLHVLLKERSNGQRLRVLINSGSHVARVFEIVGANERVFLCSDLDKAIHDSHHPTDSPAIR